MHSKELPQAKSNHTRPLNNSQTYAKIQATHADTMFTVYKLKARTQANRLTAAEYPNKSRHATTGTALTHQNSTQIPSAVCSLTNLRRRLADRHQTSYTCSMVIQIYEIRSEIWGQIGVSLSPESWRPKNVKISARFRTTSRLDREYLRNTTSQIKC